MHLEKPVLAGLVAMLCSSLMAQADLESQHIVGASVARLPLATLQVLPPSSRVSGSPGNFAIENRSCNASAPDALRRRIVNVAVQEWAYFGYLVDDLRGTSSPESGSNNARRRFPGLERNEVEQVASSVAGYWSAIPNSDWILARQNERWREPDGLATRWRDPWSAAFISWVMCESGIADPQQFQRAIAHHSYIDQAIKARDNKAPDALFVAYDPGEMPVLPGDLLCSGLRPVYRNLDERRQQLGEGARTHCDIVVETSEADGTILTIGGNVRASVRMKVFPANTGLTGILAPLPTNRTIFAHLKLRTDPIEANALRQSPSLAQGSCEKPAMAGSVSLPPTLVNHLC